MSTGRPPQSADQPRPVPPERIAERAKAVWLRRGQPSGQDDEIWYEAERELAQERERTERAPSVPAEAVERKVAAEQTEARAPARKRRRPGAT